MEKKNCLEKVLIEIEEPCVMGLVNPDEREELRRRIIEKIRPDIAVLFVNETERMLKERYDLSSNDLIKEQVFSEPDLPQEGSCDISILKR